MRPTTRRSKSSRSRSARAALALVAVALLAGCAASPSPSRREILLAGQTMGSAWTVKVAGVDAASAEPLRAGIQQRFDAVDQALSTWRADSALSRFNARDDGAWVDLDPDLAAVLRYALELGALSDGAYDVTVGPLVDLWGFGPAPAAWRVPQADAIDAARARVGWRKVEVDPLRDRARKAPGVRIDLSSLGKGRGVDRVAEYLDARGVSNYLIDLSGKLRARGHNARGAAWRVAVERPGPDQVGVGGVIDDAVVSLADASIATAGDYRRFFEAQGRHYSHIIDPRTGYPVAHRTMSATVIARDCLHADALATVYMAMDPASALRVADQRADPALLVEAAGDEAGERARFEVRASRAWPAR